LEYLVVWFLCGGFSAYIASQRGANGCLWLALGFLFGPFALVAVFASGKPVQPPAETATVSLKTCPDCAEEVRLEARRCRFCGYAFPEREPITEDHLHDQECESPERIPTEPREWVKSLMSILAVVLLLGTMLWIGLSVRR
jgi:hypothetical protein